MKNESNTNLLEYIIKSAALIYGFLVFCGALYFNFYYNTFHINIFRYLDISEISVSFLHIIVPTLLYIGALIGYFYFIISVSNYKKNRDKDKSDSAKREAEKKEIERQSDFWKVENLQSLWMVIVLTSCPFFLFLSKERLSVNMVFYTYRDWFGIIFVLIPIILSTMKFNLRFATVNSMIVLIMASVYNAIGDVQYTIEKSEKTTFTIITKDNDTTVTNKTFYFVGRTNQYIFLYNSKENLNIDIPASEIKKYIINST